MTLNLFLVSWRFEPNLTLLAVNAVGYACPPPSSLNFKCFGPAKATEKAATDKCHAWLLASSKSQDTRQVASNASTPLHSPCLQESLLKVSVYYITRDLIFLMLNSVMTNFSPCLVP